MYLNIKMSYFVTLQAGSYAKSWLAMSGKLHRDGDDRDSQILREDH